MLTRYQNYIAKVLKADSVTWLAGYAGEFGQKGWKADLLNGWKIVDVVHPPKSDIEPKAAYNEYFEFAKMHGVSAMAEKALATVGETRVIHFDNDLWNDLKQSPEKGAFYEKFKIGPRMLGVYNLGHQAESYILIDRIPDSAPFTQEDKADLYCALAEFPRVHFWLFLERGLLPPAEKPITPRLQEILRLLQQNLSEQEIADTLELSAGTVHGYVMNIYKNYDVNGRAELMSLWLQDAPGIG